jgi:CheY-like chemotaxis protein
LVNAVQSFSPELPRRAEIRVTSGTDAHGHAVIEIADTGDGIPPEHLHRIFDPFFTTKPVGLGTGIGLSVCHSTVKAMNGEILVESAPGVGTSFRVRLPGVAFGADETRSSVQRKRVGVGSRALSVLVLDDDQAVGEAIALALPGHAITLADGAEEGLAAVTQGPFDAILCDVMMPGVNGIEFYERLARASPHHLARVIFITGGVLSREAREFLEQRQVPCLEKPVSAEDLEASLVRLVAPENVNPNVRDVPRTDTG